MTTFDKYFNKTEEEANEQTKELTFRKVKRGFESAVDQIDNDILELEVRVEKHRVNVAQGTVQGIDNLMNDLYNIEKLKEYKAVLSKEQKSFVG